MIELFEIIYPWILVIIFVIFLLLFLGVIKIVFRSKINGSFQVSDIEKKILIALMLLLITSVLLEGYRSHFILNNIQDMLKVSVVKIETEGGFAFNKAQFIQDFSKVRTFKHSGSSPEESINLSIIAFEKKLTLNLKRDSREKNLYWVYCSKYLFSGSLGYLKTEVFSSKEFWKDVQGDSQLD